jgi:DNA-binding transcriptional LysR family regulator
MRHITLKQLRLVASAARLGSFSAAAQANALTPPAVSMQIKQLEDQIRMPLFERAADGLRPTQAGTELVIAARKVEAALVECLEGLTSLAALGSGRVVVGVVSTAKYFAPRMLAAFARKNPRIDLQLIVGNRQEVLARFVDGDFDVAIMGRPPENAEVDSDVIGPHPHVIVAPPDHPLADRAGLKLDDLRNEVFLGREPGSGTQMLMDGLFASAGYAPRIGMQIGSNETIKQAVMAGLGIAFLSAHTIAAELIDERLVILDVEGLPMWRKWFVVRLAQRREMPAAQALRRFLVTEGPALLPMAGMPRLPAAAQ